MGGGQFKQAIQQIIEAESQPVRSMTAKKSKIDAKLKLFQDFKSKFAGLDQNLLELSGFRKFRELKVDLGEGSELVSVTLDKDKAEPGSYAIEVNKLASRTSMISNGMENPDEPVLGTGFIAIELENGESTELYVDNEHASLRGLASLLNHEENCPVQAAVIKDASDTDAPWKLILSGKKDGLMNEIKFPDFYFLDGSSDFYIDDNIEASNAEIAIDGFPIELESNQATDFLPGVNLHLKHANPDHPFNLTITEDYKKISGKVKGAVDQLNQILQFIISQNAVDANSDTSSTFTGDSSLQNMEFQIRNIVHQGYGVVDPETKEVTATYLSQMGIEFNKSGQIEFKEDKFTKSMESNFNTVSQALSSQSGFANQARILISNYTRPTEGMLSTKEQTLKSRIKEIDTQIEQKNRYIDRKRQGLVEQFARLESTLSNMQKQQQYLSAAMPGGGGGGGNILSQLMG